MDLLAELTRLNPDPALLDGVKQLLGDAQNKDLKIQQLTTSCDLEVLKNHKLTLELAYYKRLRFGVRNEALTAEQRHLFDDDTDQDLAAIEVELETPATSIRTPRIRAGRQPLPEHLTRIEIRHEPETCTCANASPPWSRLAKTSANSSTSNPHASSCAATSARNMPAASARPSPPPQ